MKKKIPVFVYKKNSDQEGNGHYSMVACFVALGVHVPFAFYAHSENEYLKSVGKPIPCDGSCEYYEGSIKDFGEKIQNVKTRLDLYDLRSDVESLTPEELKKKFESLMFVPGESKEKKEE